MEENNINRDIDLYAQLNNEINELKKKKEEVKTRILIYMAENQIDDLQTEDGVKATYKTYIRKTLNKETLENFCQEQNIDWEKFYDENESKTLRITSKETRDKWKERNK